MFLHINVFSIALNKKQLQRSASLRTDSPPSLQIWPKQMRSHAVITC